MECNHIVMLVAFIIMFAAIAYQTVQKKRDAREAAVSYRDLFHRCRLKLTKQGKKSFLVTRSDRHYLRMIVGYNTNNYQPTRIRLVMHLNIPERLYLRLSPRFSDMSLERIGERWTDDDEFDRRFRIASSPAHFAGVLFGPNESLRSQLNRLRVFHSFTIEVKAGRLYFKQPHTSLNIYELEKLLKALESLATIIETAATQLVTPEPSPPIRG